MYRREIYRLIRIANRLTVRPSNVSLSQCIITARDIDRLPSIYEYLWYIWIKCNVLISLFITNLLLIFLLLIYVSQWKKDYALFNKIG